MSRVISSGVLACLISFIAISKVFAISVLDVREGPSACTFAFQLLGNSIIIKASAGDKTGFFLLDSGSPHLILNARHFRNGRRKTTDFRSDDLTGKVNQNLEKTYINLKVENIEKRNQEAFLIDLSSIEKSKKIDVLGVIGCSFLKHFEVVLDYQQKEMTLVTLDGRGKASTNVSLGTVPVQVIRLKQSGHLLYLEAKVNDETLKLGLDFGAEISVFDKEVIREFESNYRPSHVAALVAFNGKKSSVNVGSVNQVAIGKTELELLEVIVMDLSPINRNLVAKLDGLLGNRFLARYKISINYKKRTLTIWDPVISPLVSPSEYAKA